MPLRALRRLARAPPGRRAEKCERRRQHCRRARSWRARARRSARPNRCREESVRAKERRLLVRCRKLSSLRSRTRAARRWRSGAVLPALRSARARCAPQANSRRGFRWQKEPRAAPSPRPSADGVPLDSAAVALRQRVAAVRLRVCRA